MIDFIRGKLRARRANRILNRPAVQTPHGFKFAGPKAMEDGAFEATETRFLKSAFARADRFINIGANFGYFVCLANSMDVPAIAVEPVPLNQKLLRKNLASNGFESLTTLHACACGAQTGEAEIFGMGTGASLVAGWARNPNSLHVKIDVRTLDDLLDGVDLTENTVFLCDVEGFELEALRGADSVLAHPAKPIWMIETGLTDMRAGTSLNPNFLPLFDLVSAHGYSLYPMGAPETALTRSLITESIAAGEDRIGEVNFLLCPAERADKLRTSEWIM